MISLAPIRTTALRLTGAALLMQAAIGTGQARAGVAIEPQAIFSPFDHAVVTLEWGESQSRFSGVIRWANPATANVSLFDTNLFDLSKVSKGDRVVLGETFSRGQELILGYAETDTGKTLYTHKDPELAVYLDIVARSKDEYLIFAPALQVSDGKSTEMDNAMIILRFAQLPSPGTGVFIGALMLVASRRR